MFEVFFKAMGEPTRLRIIRLLVEQELCVCELEEIMQISQPRISQHLKVLKQAGLVNERREAQKRMCSFNRAVYEDFIEQLEEFISSPLAEIPGFKDDYVRLSRLELGQCAK
jgi:ArsR family transcriptional regulator, arsenate/arsenite/antimonite-responsive transcriptional repressor